jgi:2-haloacid dehalogenase/putative hydrolase of the HAD superfamily
MQGRYRAVLWDYGNVLVRWDPRRLYRQIFSDTSEVEWFLANVCTMAWHLKHDQGVAMADNAEPLKGKFPEYADEIDAWRLRFGEMLGGEIDGVGAILDGLAARGYRLGLLTNMPGEVAEVCFDGFDRLGLFNGVTVSGFEKVAKPDAAAFERALAAMGAEAEHTFFIDDSAGNVAAAEKMGMGAHLFTSVEGLRKALKAADIAF